MKKVLIGMSWPYANGRLHIGHLASSLPADAIARFHRAIGNAVSFVSGADCYGTPILVKAKQEGVTPAEVAEKYYNFQVKDFGALGFTFTKYSKTMCDEHKKFVTDFHKELYKSEYIYEAKTKQLYCEKCAQFLPDRYVIGICPNCGKEAKGDSCDYCGKPLEPEELKDPKCTICGGVPVLREQTQMYLAMSKMQKEIEKFFDARKKDWSSNAVGMTKKYLAEGLKDRAITRSMTWGIDVPRDGWDEKRIYIWAENVLGYFSASAPEFRKNNPDALHYYVHAKDNVPFHGVILPALLMANGGDYHLPDILAATEYVMLNGEKLSKSKGNLIEAHIMYENFDVDMVRYFFLRTANDRRDSNFTPEDFVNTINGELVNNFGNLVNRVLSFIINKFAGAVPIEKMGQEVKDQIENIKKEYNELMYRGNTHDAIRITMDLVNFGNKWFALGKPWATGDRVCVAEVIEIIRVCTDLLEPFVPFACEKIKKWLDSPKIDGIEVLYTRLDMSETKKIFEGVK